MLKPVRNGSKIQMRDISIFAQNSHFTHFARPLLPHHRTPVISTICSAQIFTHLPKGFARQNAFNSTPFTPWTFTRNPH
jgi:hypothetical protein